jgi:hypothetical protein
MASSGTGSFSYAWGSVPANDPQRAQIGCELRATAAVMADRLSVAACTNLPTGCRWERVQSRLRCSFSELRVVEE